MFGLGSWCACLTGVENNSVQTETFADQIVHCPCGSYWFDCIILAGHFANVFVRLHFATYWEWYDILVLGSDWIANDWSCLSPDPGYHAPLNVYTQLSSSQVLTMVQPIYSDLNVCVGKEWYRFPNSFYLPTPKWHLHFVRSEFRGQLPQPYSPHNNATWVVPDHMNDMNLEEPSRYVSVLRHRWAHNGLWLVANQKNVQFAETCLTRFKTGGLSNLEYLATRNKRRSWAGCTHSGERDNLGLGLQSLLVQSPTPSPSKTNYLRM